MAWVERSQRQTPIQLSEGVGRRQAALPGKQVRWKLCTRLLLAFRWVQRGAGRGVPGSAAVVQWEFSRSGTGSILSLQRSCYWFWRGSKRGSETFTGWGQQERGTSGDLIPWRCPGEVTWSRSCVMHQEGGALSKEAPVWTSPVLPHDMDAEEFHTRCGCLVPDPSVSGSSAGCSGQRDLSDIWSLKQPSMEES